MTQNKYDYKSDFDQVIQDAPVNKVAPLVQQNVLPEESTNRILEVLSKTLEIDIRAAVVAVCLLFLKGASSNGAPLSMSITLANSKEVTKRDLLYCYEMVTGNKFIRRMAEAMAKEISKYAEMNGLQGDLAKRIQTRHRAETGESLSPKELAWCSSFCQNLADLDKLASDRVSKLLAQDYSTRFIKAKKAKVEEKSPSNKAKKGSKPNAPAEKAKGKTPSKVVKTEGTPKKGTPPDKEEKK